MCTGQPIMYNPLTTFNCYRFINSFTYAVWMFSWYDKLPYLKKILIAYNDPCTVYIYLHSYVVYSLLADVVCFTCTTLNKVYLILPMQWPPTLNYVLHCLKELSHCMKQCCLIIAGGMWEFYRKCYKYAYLWNVFKYYTFKSISNFFQWSMYYLNRRGIVQIPILPDFVFVITFE